MQLHEMIDAMVNAYGGEGRLAADVGIHRATLNRYRRSPDDGGRTPDAAMLALLRATCGVEGDAKRDLWVAWVVARGAPESEVSGLSAA